MKALIIDDHALFREGFSLLLGGLATNIELHQAGKVSDAEATLQGSEFELIFLDWWLHDSVQGVAAMAAVMAMAPSARLVILSGERSQIIVDLAIEKGASGFIPKEVDKDELTRALKKIVSGGIYLPVISPIPIKTAEQDTEPWRSVSDAFPQLTARQADVLRVALRGQSNKQIARVLGISVATVATHLSAIYPSIGVGNRTEAVFLASKRGARIN